MKSGSIQSLWRYPVKSLLGEKLDRIAIDQRGFEKDRLFAISNSDGKFGSGKDTRRFRRIDGLFSMSSEYISDGVRITFPDGCSLTHESVDIHKKLSQILGQNVTLTKEDHIPHFDDGSIHILTSYSLSKLQKELPNVDIDERRFRPNIVLNTELNLLDDDLIDRTIKIGDVILKVSKKAIRCRMVTLSQNELTKQPKLLKEISKFYDLEFGVYASVIKTGVITNDDCLEILCK